MSIDPGQALVEVTLRLACIAFEAQAYQLCLAIERLPASEQQTKVSVMAAELRKAIGAVTKGEMTDMTSGVPTQKEIKLGDTVIDLTTGYVGVVTSLVTYLSGSPRAQVETPVVAGKRETEWFELARLTHYSRNTA